MSDTREAMFETPVREYMSHSLISARPSTPLVEIERTLEERDISSVVITGEDGAPLGIVSMTDMLRASLAIARGERGKASVAGDVMQTAVIGVDEGQTVREAAQAMVTYRIHRVLVNRGDKAVGMLATRDVMRAVMFHHVDLPLSSIMTTSVETVGVGETIQEAIKKLGDKSVRGLVVVDDDYPVGLFTQAEALKAQTLPRDVLNMPVEEVMSYAVTSLDQATPLYRVAGHAIAVRARRIIAVEGRSLRGIATGFDLAKVATMDEV